MSIDQLCMKPVSFGCRGSDTCSPFFSTSEVGDYCRGQYAKLPQGDKDTVIEDYCLRHTDSDECKCVNRSTDVDYQKLKLGNPYPDSCWYIPCANRFKYFTPSEFDAVTDCPQNICQIVYDISKVHDVDIDKVKNDINCDFSHGGSIPDPTTTLPLWVYAGAIALLAAFIVIYAFKRKID